MRGQMWWFVCLPLLGIALFAKPGTVHGATSTGRQWTRIEAAAPAGCAFDAPFEFWVREGDASRLLVFLQGGGACWDLETCDPARAIRFDSRIDSADHVQRREGVFDTTVARNPFREFTAVFVPYCTGDFHLGARQVRYGGADGVVVKHTGWHNLQAVLEYLSTRAVAPDLIVVSGASAGGVASPVMAAEVARLFPRAVVNQIADGSAGLRFAEARTLLRQWGADEVLADAGLRPPEDGDALTGLYLAAAAQQPRIRFTHIATANDEVVARGLRMFGGAPEEVAGNIALTYEEIRRAGLCFAGYTLAGRVHTILWRASFLSAELAEGPLAEVLGRAVAQPPCEPSGGQGEARDAVALFAYRPRPGMDSAFEEGYRRHLAWHRAHRDSLAWLGWTVLSGVHAGMFVDGTFGNRFAAFDERVEVRADAADAAANVTAFADPVFTQMYRLRRELGTAAPLEAARPGPMQEVLWLTVRPGAAETFEGALRSLRRGELNDFAVYERVLGGSVPAYLVVTQLSTWQALQDHGAVVSAAILRAAGDALIGAESEIWRYRADLTYIPDPAPVR